MPKKGYKQTEEHKEKIRLHHLSLGENHWSHRPEVKIKLVKGLIHDYWKGKKRDDPEYLEKIRISHLGQVNVNKGKILGPISEKVRINRIGLLSGSKHPNWKGGVTSINSLIRNSFKYKEWRTQVFKRDYWTCILCNKKEGIKIEADHYPKMFSELISTNNIDSLEKAIDCQELWNIDNGRTLCKNCHKEHGKRK